MPPPVRWARSGAIASCVTIAGDLPDSDESSEQWLDRLHAPRQLGIADFVFDFGHPLEPEPALRFGEQVIAASELRPLSQLMKPMRSITTWVGLAPPRILMRPSGSQAVITPLAMF